MATNRQQYFNINKNIISIKTARMTTRITLQSSVFADYCGIENDRKVGLYPEHFRFDVIMEFGLEQIGWFHLAFSTFKLTASSSSGDFLISTISGPRKMIENGTEQSAKQKIACDCSKHVNSPEKIKS